MKRTLAIALILCLWCTSFGLVGAQASEIASDSTSMWSANSAKRNNIELAAAAISGTYVGYGDEFSFNDTVGARTAGRGYLSAINGRGVKVTGGGVAQVAATLYLALKQLGSDITYTEKRTYGDNFTDDYVSSGKDAIITDYSGKIDFSFINYYDSFTINMWVDDDTLWCTLDTNGGGGGGGGGEGYASIYLSGNNSQINNIELAANSIYDTTLNDYGVFSFNDIVGPRTERYGYKSAINGRGVKVLGGGVAQVASAVWLAIQDLDCVDILERKTYGSRYNQDYVASSDDAIVTDYNDDIDFRFRYVGGGTLTIYTYVSDDYLVCEVFEE